MNISVSIVLCILLCLTLVQAGNNPCNAQNPEGTRDSWETTSTLEVGEEEEVLLDYEEQHVLARDERRRDRDSEYVPDRVLQTPTFTFGGPMLGPSNTSASQSNFVGSNNSTLCKVCQIRCGDFPMLKNCQSKYYNYGCFHHVPCASASSASKSQIMAAIGFCVVYAKCSMASTINTKEALNSSVNAMAQRNTPSGFFFDFSKPCTNTLCKEKRLMSVVYDSMGYGPGHYFYFDLVQTILDVQAGTRPAIKTLEQVKEYYMPFWKSAPAIIRYFVSIPCENCRMLVSTTAIEPNINILWNNILEKRDIRIDVFMHAMRTFVEQNANSSLYGNPTLASEARKFFSSRNITVPVSTQDTTTNHWERNSVRG